MVKKLSPDILTMLCNLRDCISYAEGRQEQEIQDEFEELATCIKHNLPVPNWRNYQVSQTWFKKFLKEN